MSARELIEEGDAATDGRGFRRCLGQFATGVTVMTTRHEGQYVGMAVNSFAALSLEPPLVLWSIRRHSAMAPAFAQAGRFVVNVLASDQADVAELFATPGIDKFAVAQWRKDADDDAILNCTIATMACELDRVLDGGDHLILIGRVRHFARYDGEPLLFSQGRYAAGIGPLRS
ncbi:MAG: flavin reductase family protein [Burkholderiales bacterium]|nr:flavin reductase family protein [Burkholderiales bacterium]